MTSTIQECVMLNRGSVDKWTIREQLCLASAVLCSGDRNWISVSRSLKLLCDDGTAMRPIDWFSENNCAIQYGVLEESLEMEKCKKPSYDSSSRVSSPVAEDKSTELILRQLNEKRQQELKAEIRKEQEEFVQIYKDLKALQSGTLNKEELHEMWCDIELQKEQERVEEMKIENQMREREQQKPQTQCNWRKLLPVKTHSVLADQHATDTTSVDMDVEDLTGASNTEQMSTNFNQTKQKQQPAHTGISPLLSSLLKSPTPGTSSPTSISTNTSTSSGNNSARSSAPTITTLLTCGSIPNKNQPAITLKSSIPPQKAAQLLSSPISGPPSITSVPVTSMTGQNLLSPSQAAPTLSMLLERNKALAITVTNAETRNAEIPKAGLDGVEQSQINEIKNEVSDSNNDEVPMDLDEDITIHLSDGTENRNNENDSDEPDPNEEQQLLEVFKNIGNIDELDIDVSAVIDGEEVDFLKDMGADSPNDIRHVEDFVHNEHTSVSKGSNVLENTVENEKSKNEVNLVDDAKMFAKEVISLVEETKPNIKNVEINQQKIETTSSDDSNDNIPLSAVASLEQRAVNEKVVFNDKVSSEIKNSYKDEGIEPSINSDAQEIETQSTFEEDNKEHDKLEKQLADLVGENDGEDTKNFIEDEKSAAASECSDVIVIPTDDDDSNGQKDKQTVEKSEVDEEAEKIKNELENDIVSLEGVKYSAKQEEELPEVTSNIARTGQKVTLPVPPTISIADTDEESSTTDISFANRKDDNITSNKQSTVSARRSLIDQNRQDQQSKTDDESTTQFSSSSSSSLTPARPPVLRKLRDRDRSESPMIDGEVHPSINNASVSTLDNFSNQRLRRRYSSTPINDSVPNSPASSDRDREEPETRVSKKSLLSIFHALQYSKNANVLQRSFNEDAQFNEICLRPIDMVSIRKCIESGTIRNVSELQRDILLMCQNGLMLFKQDTAGFNAANAFMLECQAMREFVANTGVTENNIPVKENKEGNKSLNMSGTSSKSRSGSRKSQRIS